MRFTKLALLFLCATAAVWAQATAQITGSVVDSTGLAVPGAEIKVTQTETGVVRTATTGADGVYVLPNLPTGPYTLEATKQGFSTYVQRGIVLQVATSPTVEITLKVGSVSEQVQVEANAALVETQNAGVSQVIENQRILELPLNGRNPADLIQMIGTAVGFPQGSAANASSRSFQGVLGGEGFSVAGGQSSSVSYQLDGATHNNPYDNLNLPLPFPDALQEFKVETSALTAQNGFHAGAAVSAVTKSGTNDLHGDVFWFLRNPKVNATNPFVTAKGPDGRRLTDGQKRNQFGGTVGGPIVKNKIFFFAGYQGTKTRTTPASTEAFVPTADMLRGDFTTIASAACQAGRAITMLSPFVANRISPVSFSPAAVKIAAKLPQPQNACGNIRYVLPDRQDEWQLIGKGDVQLSPKHSVFGRYIATTQKKTPPYALLPDNILTTNVGGRDNLAQTMTIGDTYLVGPTTINSFRATFNRTAIHRLHQPFFSAPQMGINAYSYQSDVMLMTVTGGGNFAIGGGTESESRFKTTTYQLGDDISLIRGKHQFAFGVNAALWNSASYANVRSPGVYSFDGTQTGLGMGDFLTGKLALLNASAPNTILMRQWYLGFYAQDTWKITPRLTLNAGLRWEPWFPQVITNGAIYNFSLDRFLKGTKSTVYQNAPAGLYYPGDPGFPGKSGQYHKPFDIGPRVALAWDPKGDGKMSIRASYGMFYDFPNGQFFINSTIAPPFGDEVRNAFPAGGLDNPWTGFPGGNPFPVSFDPKNAYFPILGPYLTLNYDMPATAVHAWNLSLQRQIGKDWLVSASYLGNETQHLWTSTQVNPGTLIPGAPIVATCAANSTTQNCNANLNPRRLLSQLNPTAGAYYAAVDVFDPGGTQSYNGLLLSMQKRISGGLTVQTNYAWSHCIGDYSQEFTTPNLASGYQFPNNRRADRGDCMFDRRSNFSVNAVYQTPKAGNRITGMITGAWKVAGIFRYITAPPLTALTGVDRNLTGNSATQRINQVLPDVSGGGFLTNFFNPAAFANPNLGTNGNMGTYTLRGVGNGNLDMSLSRTFRVWENRAFDIRGDAFNLNNSFQRGQPTASFSSNQFGQISSAVNPRVLQFAAKFIF
jgi:hypothetical protein